MNATDFIAIYAAIISTGALFLEVRRWFESGPKIKIDIMPLANLVGGLVEDRNDYLHVSATNTGDRATTVSLLVIHEYSSFFRRLIEKPDQQFFVPKPDFGGAQQLPFLLNTGVRWGGSGKYDDTLRSLARSGKLYAGVSCSHRSRPYLRRVNPKRFVEADLAAQKQRSAEG